MVWAGEAEALERELGGDTDTAGDGEARESAAAPGVAVNGTSGATSAAVAPATGLDPPLVGDSHLRRGPAAIRCTCQTFSKQIFAYTKVPHHLAQ